MVVEASVRNLPCASLSSRAATMRTRSLSPAQADAICKKDERLTVQSIKELVAINRRLPHEADRSSTSCRTHARHFSGGSRPSEPSSESVNLVFAIKSTMEAMEGDDPQKKELAIIGLVGSSLTRRAPSRSSSETPTGRPCCSASGLGDNRHLFGPQGDGQSVQGWRPGCGQRCVPDCRGRISRPLPAR